MYRSYLILLFPFNGIKDRKGLESVVHNFIYVFMIIFNFFTRSSIKLNDIFFGKISLEKVMSVAFVLLFVKQKLQVVVSVNLGRFGGRFFMPRWNDFIAIFFSNYTAKITPFQGRSFHCSRSIEIVYARIVPELNVRSQNGVQKII